MGFCWVNPHLSEDCLLVPFQCSYSPPFLLYLRPSSLRVLSLYPQHQHRLRACEKCRLSAPTFDLQDYNLVRIPPERREVREALP